ncbi:MAG TPA: hypothetical protein VFE29_00650 [Terriglobia bacterium]|nr:hypothetical protein [Terriglobia bacterium]
MDRILKIGVGAACVFLALMFAIPFFLTCACSPNEIPAVSNLRTINTAQVTYFSSSGRYGTITELISANLIDDSFKSTKAGYDFTVTLDATGSSYRAEAVPISSLLSTPSGTRHYSYYSVPDAVVRYSTNAPTPGQIGKSVQ